MTWFKWLGGALLAALLVLGVWGSSVEPRLLLDVETHEAPVRHLPPAWEGRTVALLADLQVGMWLDNSGMVRRAVKAAVEADPALILIAGDFVYEPDSAVVREAVSLVEPLAESGAPVVAVLGNHDYSLMNEESQIRIPLARYLESELEAAGITVLENESVALGDVAGTAPLYVVGIGSDWARRARPDVALASVPEGAARIFLMHNPIVFLSLPAAPGGLSLAAHTHGGQVRLPIFPSESWLKIARSHEIIADGWAADSIGAAGNRLYVNRGIGFSALPIRILCRPELTLLTLRRDEDAVRR